MRFSLLAASLALLATPLVSAAFERRQTTTIVCQSPRTSLKRGWNMITINYDPDGVETSVPRKSSVYVPSGATTANKMSILLALHDSHSSGGRSFVEGNDLTQLAEDNNAIILAPTGGVKYAPTDSMPNGDGWTWNVSFVPPKDPSKISEGCSTGSYDRPFLKALLLEAQSYNCVEPSKTYAMGMSGGGRMASSLACSNDISKLLGGIAAFSSLRAGPADPAANPIYSKVLTEAITAPGPYNPKYPCAPAHGLGIFAVHGSSDNINPIEGNPVGKEEAQWGYPVQQASNTWSNSFTCTGPDNTTDTASNTVTKITKSTYKCQPKASTAAGMVVYVIDGMGHDLPTPDKTKTDFNYKKTMWDFFQGYRTA